MPDVKIYTDTNALRYLCNAFACTDLALDLKNQLLLSPLTVMELVSQLGTGDAAEAFATIQALPHVQNAAATGMLPWADDLFRMSIFNLPPGEDTLTPALRNAVVKVLNALRVQDLRDEGKEMRALLDTEKNYAARQFADVINAVRSEGPLAEAEQKTIFARAIARQAHVDENKIDIDFVTKSLDAYFVFEKSRIDAGAKHYDYNVYKRANDVYDAELLIYLADPRLHLLTGDKGFRRIQGSSQANRVHIVDPACLTDPECATKTLRSIVGAA